MAGRIRVFDTLTRRARPLPVSKGSDGRPELKLYVCGITPYDSGHLGHAFTFAAFDVLARWAAASGVAVRYVQNVTDVDDPLFERARRDRVGWRELAEGEVRGFRADLEALGCRLPEVMPKVSEEIPAILEAVKGLAEKGYGYEAGGTLYFDVSRYPGYGQLSHRSRRSMIRKLRDEGMLGEVGPGGKRSPLDFPLWRPSGADEPAWPSEFGAGRPGWHIECSAMSMRYLGEQVDVHGGGRDLVFSHHESERAQSESLTGCVPFARAWVHTGMVRYEGRKMSKSLGNLVNVGQVLERVPAAAVRLYLASHRYRRDWSFRWEGLERAARLAHRAGRLLEVERGGGAGPAVTAPPRGAAAAEFAAALDDDLDTPRALRALRAAVRRGDAESTSWMLSILAGDAALA